jgi:hypothetical protein
VNAIAAFLNDRLDLGKPDFGRVVRLKRAARAEPGAQHREDDNPDDRFVDEVKWAVDENAPEPK